MNEYFNSFYLKKSFKDIFTALTEINVLIYIDVSIFTLNITLVVHVSLSRCNIVIFTI